MSVYNLGRRENKMDKNLIETRLRALFDKDKNREQTAKKLGVSRATIFNWFKDPAGRLDLDSVEKIAKVYNTSVEWILGQESDEDKIKNTTIKRINEKIGVLSQDELNKIEAMIDLFLSK